ncbi:MAG: hypothetical protein ABI450_07680, partial [Rhizomicrobium sp.]
EVEATRKLVMTVMEKAALPVAEITVPLVVEARAADNWDAAHCRNSACWVQPVPARRLFSIWCSRIF